MSANSGDELISPTFFKVSIFRLLSELLVDNLIISSIILTNSFCLSDEILGLVRNSYLISHYIYIVFFLRLA